MKMQEGGNAMRSAKRYVIACTFLFGMDALHGATPNLCQAGETTYVSCTVGKGPKQLALCGQVKGTPGQVEGYLQYRFGTRERLELVYPASKPGSLDKFTWSHDYRKTGRTDAYEVGFRNGRYEYTVYTMSYPLGDEESDGYANEAGVRIASGGKEIATVECGSALRQALGELGLLQ